jgi:predicted nucleotidyltransferase
MNRDEVIGKIAGRFDRLRREFNVRSLSIFGSVARDEARPESDVDVLVDFAGPATFDDFMGLKLSLEDLLGVRIDLVTRSGLRPRLRAMVEREAIRVA